MAAAIIFIFGTMVGSFLNCVIYRLEKGGLRQLADLRGRSYCPHCKHMLSWKDLFPILSFIWLGGRCRYCGKKISWQYPLVEIATGILFVFIVGNQLSAISYQAPIADYQLLVASYWLLLTGFLVIIFVYDLKHYIIPDRVIYPAIGLALVYDLLRSDPLGRSDFFLSAFGAAGFFAAIVLLSRGKWMGAGDIKLAFLMGLVLGYPNILVALSFAFFLGAIIGIGLMILGKKTMKSEVPFGPFLVAGTLIALFFGSEIINWYVQSFYPH